MVEYRYQLASLPKPKTLSIPICNWRRFSFELC